LTGTFLTEDLEEEILTMFPEVGEVNLDVLTPLEDDGI